MPFDYAGAKQAGYSDADIANFLAQQQGFDYDGAKKAGYSDAEIAGHLKGPQPTGPDTPSAAQQASAAAAGFNYGAVPGALGLPVDTLINAWDLGKAGLGYLTSKVTGSAPPAVFDPADRSQYVGSSAWIANQIRKLPHGSAVIDNPAPQDPVARALYAGGNAAGSTMALGGVSGGAPTSNVGMLRDLGSATASGIAAQEVGEKTGNPTLALTASFVPTLAAQGAAAATRGLMRGTSGDQMRQNIQDAKTAGTTLTVGQASQGALPQFLEGALSKIPGAYSVFRNKGLQQNADLAGALDYFTNSYANEPVQSGEVIQKGIKSGNPDNPGFMERFKAKQGELYNKVDSLIPPTTPVVVNNTKDALYALTAPTQGAPNIGERFINGDISRIRSAFDIDAGLTPPGVVPGEGAWRPPDNPTLPYQAVTGLRTQVGNALSDSPLTSTVPNSQFKRLYGAMSGDLQAAADAAGPQAQAAFNRANAYTSGAYDRLDRLQPYVNANTPEQAFYRLVNSANAGPSQINAVKRSLTPDQWGQVVSNVVSRLGRATPGQQNAEGDAFSPATFLTNWNRMDPRAKSALVGGFDGAADLRAKLDAMAKTTGNLKSSAQVLANPSGTAQASNASHLLTGALLGGGEVASYFANPWAALAIPTGLGVGYGAAKAMTNPGAVSWLAQPTQIAPEVANSYLARMPGLLNLDLSGEAEQTKKAKH
jgi:hypothetical protein